VEGVLSNISVGVDVEENGRFSDLNMKNDAKFLEKIFTKNELEYCFSTNGPAQHLAVRFAAKEAVIKAISALGEKKPPLKAIEVRRESTGVPTVSLLSYDIKISLSHSRNSSIAVALIAKVD